MLPELEKTIAELSASKVSPSRRAILQQVVDYVRVRQELNKPVKLNFICTHNSRRSQMAQVWAQTAIAYYKLNILCFSGGIEVTAFHENAVAALEEAGFEIQSEGKENSRYFVKFSNSSPPITAYSKLYDDPSNPGKDFAAIMTCDEADANCPYIPGADKRISLLYEDPKEFDNSALASEKYIERSNQIGAEMFYMFSQLAPKF